MPESSRNREGCRGALGRGGRGCRGGSGALRTWAGDRGGGSLGTTRSRSSCVTAGQGMVVASNWGAGGGRKRGPLGDVSAAVESSWGLDGVECGACPVRGQCQKTRGRRGARSQGLKSQREAGGV